MADGDAPDHDEVDDGTSIERDGEPEEAGSPPDDRLGRGVAGLGMLVALVAGAIVGFVVGGGTGGGSTSDDPDLQALCIMVGAVDDDDLDRLESGGFSVDDPLLARLSAIPQLALAAGGGDGAPEGLAEAAAQVDQGVTRLQFDEVREEIEELRTYC